MRKILNKKAQGMATNKIVAVVLVILVIAAVLMFIFKADLLSYIKNLPGFDSTEDGELDVTQMSPDDLAKLGYTCGEGDERVATLDPVQLGNWFMQAIDELGDPDDYRILYLYDEETKIVENTSLVVNVGDSNNYILKDGRYLANILGTMARNKTLNRLVVKINESLFYDVTLLIGERETYRIDGAYVSKNRLLCKSKKDLENLRAPKEVKQEAEILVIGDYGFYNRISSDSEFEAEVVLKVADSKEEVLKKEKQMSSSEEIRELGLEKAKELLKNKYEFIKENESIIIWKDYPIPVEGIIRVSAHWISEEEKKRQEEDKKLQETLLERYGVWVNPGYGAPAYKTIEGKAIIEENFKESVFFAKKGSVFYVLDLDARFDKQSTKDYGKKDYKIQVTKFEDNWAIYVYDLLKSPQAWHKLDCGNWNSRDADPINIKESLTITLLNSCKL